VITALQKGQGGVFLRGDPWFIMNVRMEEKLPADFQNFMPRKGSDPHGNIQVAK